MSTPLTRRRLLRGLALAAGASLLPVRLAFATGGTGDKRLVLVILRGALDGLSAPVPLGDPDYARQRRDLALDGKDGLLPLGGDFALHPSLPTLHALFQLRQAILLHAVASPYRDRSHFDAQDLLENGSDRPQGRGDGWLGRALGLLGAEGLAVGQDLPLVLQGPGQVATWAPSELPDADPGFLARVADLYAADPLLGPALLKGLEANALAGAVLDGKPLPKHGKRAEAALAEGAGKLMAAAGGPGIAVIELGGWDTHTNQGTTRGRLAVALGGLDGALAGLQRGLGSHWERSAVAVVTEFGRTVAPNGSGGTDHGTGTVAFLCGGAVAGGRIIADWPGLSPAALHEKRDLRPTLDLRAALKGLLAQHLGLGRAALDQTVFPDSAGVAPLEGLTV
jgi:uncharacterized protein (DUF1501 family)